MNVQWYPGHMTKAMRNMQEDCRLVDLIIELVDARVPGSSRNPDIDRLGQGKARLILMNKADLADQALSEKWKAWFEKKGYFVVELDSRNTGHMKAVSAVIDEACREKRERDSRKGIQNRPVRAMVVGIPNVGKSTFINTYAGRAAAKTGNKPGVTKGNQWIRLNRNVELLDTPGVLWPKFEDAAVGVRLAAIGSINDEILNREELCGYVLRFLELFYPGALEARYAGVSADAEPENVPLSDLFSRTDVYGPAEAEILTGIAKVRGCLGRGGVPDTEKASRLLLDDFRSGRLGRVTLEAPEG